MPRDETREFDERAADDYRRTKNENTALKGRIVVLERQAKTHAAKTSTMLLALKRVPQLFGAASALDRACVSFPVVPFEVASAQLEAFRAQLAQFEHPTFTSEQEVEFAAKLEEMGKVELVRSQLIEHYQAGTKALEQRYQTALAQAGKKQEEIVKSCDALLDEVQDKLNKAEGKSARRRARELAALKMLRHYQGVFRELVDVCRGFEGSLAEQVRRLCARQLDETEAVRLAIHAAGNPGSQ